MSTLLHVRASLILLAALSAGAVYGQTQAQAEYKEGKARISTTFKTDKIVCVRLTGNDRDVCLEEAKGKRKTAQAKLEYGASGSPADDYRVAQAGAEADYAVARQTCMAQAGHAQGVCIKQAQAIKIHTMVDARSRKKIVELDQAATRKKRAASFALATEKCAALAAPARIQCIAQAKAAFGKN